MAAEKNAVFCLNDFAYRMPITTRWRDNDVYGHINNVVYYSYFDSAINRYLIEEGGLDIHGGEVIAYIVHSHCNYHAAAAYPDALSVGLRVAKLGNSSVTYQLALFGETGEMKAEGQVVHVFVRREDQRPTPIPNRLRDALGALVNGS